MASARKVAFGSWTGFLAFGFGSGLAPFAPGTVGTLAALPIWFLLLKLPFLSYFLVVLVAFALGIYVCDRASAGLGVHDHGGIVWDEFVGLGIALAWLPAGWAWILAAFGAFRFFDILKPWPIGWLDKHVNGGLGIMLDDVLAGLYAVIVLRVLAIFIYPNA